MKEDRELARARREYARVAPERRRAAADWVYHGAIASRMFAGLLGDGTADADPWRGEVMALAIDPLFAPALLTVGSLEYEMGRPEEAMDLFFTLTTLPEETEDLAEIVVEAGDFLIDHEEISGALDLSEAAVLAYPRVALFHNSLSYCLGKLGRHDKALEHARRAVELEPNNHKLANDLGWSLVEAGSYDEAQPVLERAIALSPPEYTLPVENLKELARRRKRKRPRLLR
ncbi:MAG: tetratricopeptide repeat protein [Acidobacteria bacterium]|nr:tetratricopeptide repeat protein [Acidobacteriota bacterium]